MPSLRDFVAALQAGWFPALAALVGCTIFIMGDYLKVPYLDQTPTLILTSAVVIGVFAFSVLAANVAYIPAAIWKALQRRKARSRFMEKLRLEVISSPAEETAILAYLVTSGRKAFAAEFGDRRLAPLVSKGILVKAGGTHNVLEWPYIVQEDVWSFLMENREQFLIDIPHDLNDPFDWRTAR